MVKKPTLVALSSLMALSVPTVSEKLSTSEMRKRSIKPNAVELNEDAQKDIPVTESEKSNVASDPDLITVELSQDGTSTVIKNNQQEENKPQTKKKDDFIPEPNMVGSSKLDITKVEVLSVKADELKFKLNSSKLSEEAVPTLKDIKEYLGERYVVITRELTKIYEEIIRGNVSEIIEKLEKKSIKGEIVLFIRALDDDGIYLKKEVEGE